MQNLYDYKRYAVLYVDDEEMALKYFEKTFGNEFRIFTAPNAVEGLKILEAHGDDIGVLMTDQRMPGQKGVQLLERARQIKPKVVRMMITAYADFGVTVDAVNLGNIFRYVSKPLQVEDMRNTLRRAMEFFLLQKERDELMREKLGVIQNMVIADRVISLGVLASGLCQHLRNPLEAVRGYLNLIPGKLREETVDVERMRDPSFWRDFHTRVLKQAGQISELIGEIDGPSLTESIQTEVAVDVGAVLNRVIGALRPAFVAKGGTLDAAIEPDLPAVRAEERRIERMFKLLLQNELDSLPAGAKLNVTARVQRSTDSKPIGIQVLVQDNGPGLPQGAVRAIFDPFCLRLDESQDFGLNLLAVFFLAHHHGGHVETTSTEGKGVTYKLDIPLLAETPPPVSSSSNDFVVKVLMNDVLWERLLAGQ
ncbi:MAG: hybrid sensor histidine kinase/response regulator [Prosthecobacter sp.]|nr:hybrid sensor histidine kinase/response regulator [Prosthecobacter sp.]